MSSVVYDGGCCWAGGSVVPDAFDGAVKLQRVSSSVILMDGYGEDTPLAVHDDEGSSLIIAQSLYWLILLVIYIGTQNPIYFCFLNFSFEGFWITILLSDFIVALSDVQSQIKIARGHKKFQLWILGDMKVWTWSVETDLYSYLIPDPRNSGCPWLRSEFSISRPFLNENR